MAKKMSESEIDAFLKQPLHAVLATHSADGPPHVSPVWFLYEDFRFYISIVGGSVKHRNLEKDPRMSLCVDGGREDVRAVMIYGTAKLVAEGSEPEAMRWRITRHFHASEADARHYYESIRELPNVLVVLEPARIVSQDFND